MTRFILALACWMLLPAAVQARPSIADGFDGGWIRAAPPGSPVMAGYVAIRNDGTTRMRIDAVESESFGAIEIHEMREVDGVMRMRPLPELGIEPGARVELAPGGIHLMLFRPQRALVAGDSVEIEFTLDDGTRRRVMFEVRAP